MSLRARLVLPTILILGQAAVQAPELSSQDIANTAVAGVFATQAAAAPLPIEVPTAQELPAPGIAANPTQCNPTVTAITVANVRGGPGTEYDVVGNLPVGGTARVAGRNDANTWWYIQFAGGFGGYAWIAGSVVSTACIPAVVPVVAAPALPTPPPPEAVEPTATDKKSLPPLLISTRFFFIPTNTPKWNIVQPWHPQATGDSEVAHESI
jgi:hypothetical protein